MCLNLVYSTFVSGCSWSLWIFQRKFGKFKMFSMTPHLDWSVLDLMRMIWNFVITSDCIFHGIPFGCDHPSVQFDSFLSVFQAWFFSLLSIKNQFNYFLFFLKLICSWSSEESSLCPSSSFSCFIFQKTSVWFSPKLNWVSFHFQLFSFLIFIFPGAKRALLFWFPSWGAYSQ